MENTPTVNSYYASCEHSVLYIYGSIMYYTLPTVRYILDHPFVINQITNELYISDFSSACDVQKLHENGITHIVTVIPGVTAMYPNEFIYYTLNVVDRPYVNIDIYFDEAVNFIDDAVKSGGKVLIHCQKGISRSATIIIAYLIKKKGYTATSALEKMKKSRSCVKPNKGFMQQLQLYSNQHTYTDDSL